MKKLSKSKFLLLIAVVLNVVSCGSSGPARTALNFEKQKFYNYAADDEFFSDSSTQELKDARLRDCPVYISSIIDKRSNPKSFGSSNNFEKFATTIPQWVEKGLLTLSKERSIKTSLPNQLSTISINVEILKAYIHFASAKNANLVLRVNFNTTNQSNSKVYRGTDTSINWNNSPEEVEEAMNAAFSKLLKNLDIDLKDACTLDS